MIFDLALSFGRKITLPGRFDVPVTLEDARILDNGYECRFRLPDGSLEETVIPPAEAAALEKILQNHSETIQRFGVRSLSLFGVSTKEKSRGDVVRGEETEGGNPDFLVEFEKIHLMRIWT